MFTSSAFISFVQQANQFGQNNQPFFFLIDFEQQKPLICPLDQAAEHGIYYQIQRRSNVEQTNFSAKPLIFIPKPMSLADYSVGFQLVKRQLQQGNSYLLNLTYPTEIKTNYNLRDFFFRCSAEYKLWLDNQFVCFSPESFIQIRHNRIFTYPMKGTIDATLPNAAQILQDSVKEQREHYTIVDLMRNDLAMVAKNIEVTRFRYKEKISTGDGAIWQTSSEISGELTEHWQHRIGDILAKLLPAGSISGAPKEKTVQIIRQAEGQPRGYYTGIFGIFDGESLDSAVTIRFIEQQAERFYFRSGGGITSQSELIDEYKELLQKVYVPVIKDNSL
ncbi:aminodeoxychorismate synthase component I [Pasteurellaceae bacterium LIM206]|nr:aminodeoxychorismate synthase component I [Pasteurellaceae bacterium LIM206]